MSKKDRNMNVISFVSAKLICAVDGGKGDETREAIP